MKLSESSLSLDVTAVDEDKADGNVHSLSLSHSHVPPKDDFAICTLQFFSVLAVAVQPLLVVSGDVSN